MGLGLGWGWVPVGLGPGWGAAGTNGCHSLTGGAIFAKSPNRPASSVRRLVIEVALTV